MSTQNSLRQKAINGIKWTSISSIVIAILQILQISILARYLSPEDFGLMAIVMVVIGFSRIFSDMGISNAIIHHQHTSHEQLSSLYWLNIASGIVLFLIIAGVSPFIANFYNQSELTRLLVLLASTFIILAVGNQYRILFQKELQFNFMAKIEISAAVVAFIVAIILAIQGFGVYALAYATLANAIISSSLFFFFGVKKHKPALMYRHNDIKEYIGFGMFQMGDSTLNYFNSQFDVILIGKLLGVEALGIYSIVKQLIMRPAQIINPIINRVTFPLMAKVQNDTTALKNIYLKTINYLSSINFPIYIAIAILAEPIIHIVFGEKFISGVRVLQILSIYAMIRSIGNPIGSLVMAKGHMKLAFYWNFILFSFIPITIYLGSGFGINGVAYALLFLQVLLMIPTWYFMVGKLCGANFIEYFRQILIPLSIATMAGAAGIAVYYFTDTMFMQVLLVSLIGGSVYVISSFYLNNNFVSMLKNFR